MKKLILIEAYRHEGKDCLKVSLTIDGSTALEDAKSKDEVLTISDLFDNEWDQDDINKLLIAHEGLKFGGAKPTIYTMAQIPYEKEPVLIKVWNPKEPILILTEWNSDPKKEFLFFPDHQNEERIKEVTAKIAAGMWATYSQQTVSAASLETNERYGILKDAYQGIMGAVRALKFDNYSNQDNLYYSQTKDVANNMEKEMDFCIHKIKLIEKLCDRNFELPEIISKLYRKMRGVTENSEQINSTTDGKENQENQTTEQGISEENTSTPNSEGNDGSHVGEVGEP